jgi:hypothetical protein
MLIIARHLRWPVGGSHTAADRDGYSKLDKFDCFAIQEGEAVYRPGQRCGVTEIRQLFRALELCSWILVNFLYLLRYSTERGASYYFPGSMGFVLASSIIRASALGQTRHYQGVTSPGSFSFVMMVEKIDILEPS